MAAVICVFVFAERQGDFGTLRFTVTMVMEMYLFGLRLCVYCVLPYCAVKCSQGVMH